MIRYSFFILCVFLGLLSATAAVPGELRGTVKDALTGEPVSSAIVKSKGAFTSTDANGMFVLRPTAEVDSVSFRCMGYEPVTLPAKAQMGDVLLLSKATELKDVIVEAPDIYAKGDTLVFDVSRYATAKDNAIIDVIKRLPGIKVEEDGTIKYQGKPINKFYIDGNDFIGGRYGLATNNISHKDVKSVEVMENHQPIKALEDIEFPEEAGINLKLKEDARSRWVGVATAATGASPQLYDASLFTMRIAPKMQNMFTVKSDNIGRNPANEIKEHDFYDMFSSDYTESLWPEYISADIVNAPLSERRTRDNLSWLANGISAWKRGDASMRLRLDYMGDRLDYRSGLTTDYFSSEIPTFIRSSKLRTQSHDLAAQFNSEINKRGYYLKDRFTLNASLDNSNDLVNGTFDLRQKVERKKMSAVNDLKLVKRNDKRLFTLTSRNAFTRRPDRLLVASDRNTVQSVGTTDIRSTTETRFGHMRRFWRFFITAGADLSYHRMNTNLTGLGDFDNSNIYNVFTSNLYAVPQIDYERGAWRLSLKTAVKWLHHSLGSRHDYVNTTPRLNIHRQLTAKSELSSSLAFRLKSPQAYLNIDVPVLSDYRNLFISSNTGSYSQAVAASLSYRYRNPLKSLFFNVSGTYNYHRSTLMSNQLFISDFIVSTYTDKVSHADNYYLKGSFSKGLWHSRIVVGCDIATSLSDASSMRDNETLPYRQLSAEAKPFFKGSITSWLATNYEASYKFSKLKINDISNSSHSLSQKFNLTFLPTDRLHFTAGAEHFLTRFPEGNTAGIVLLDASAVWQMNGKIRFSLTANNLLDKRNYRYITYGTLSRSEYYFQIRPRNILASVQYRF